MFHPRSCVFLDAILLNFHKINQPTNQPLKKTMPGNPGEVFTGLHRWGYEAEVLLFPVRPNHQETYAWRGNKMGRASSSFVGFASTKSTPARFMVICIYRCFSFGQKVCFLLGLICIGCWILLVCVNNSRLTTKTPRYGEDVEVF